MGRLTLRRWLLMLVVVGLLASARGALCQEEPTSSTRPQVGSPMPAPSAAQAMLLAQGYHLATLVLWLSAAAFGAGLMVGMAIPRRPAAWATAVVGGFLAAVLLMGSRPAPAPGYLPMLVVGGALILVAAITGGSLGHYLLHGAAARRGPGNGPEAG